jgi:hypothetical protein
MRLTSPNAIQDSEQARFYLPHEFAVTKSDQEFYAES